MQRSPPGQGCICSIGQKHGRTAQSSPERARRYFLATSLVRKTSLFCVHVIALITFGGSTGGSSEACGGEAGGDGAGRPGTPLDTSVPSKMTAPPPPCPMLDPDERMSFTSSSEESMTLADESRDELSCARFSAATCSGSRCIFQFLKLPTVAPSRSAAFC